MHVIDNFGNVGWEASTQIKQVSVIQITKPTLDSPADNGSITTPSTTFNWSHPYNDQYECIIKDPTSGAIVHQSGYISAKSHTVNWASPSSGQMLTYGKRYKWYVVVKVNGVTDSSVDRYFTYNYRQVTKPTLDLPAVNASITTSTTTFSWSHPYNDEYECIIKDPISGAIVHQSGYISAKSHTVNWTSLSSGQTLTYGKQYKWYVVVKVNGVTDSSVDRYFTYKRTGSWIPLDQLAITNNGNTSIAPQTVNTPFPIAVTAKDINGNVITGFSGVVNVSSNVCSTNPTQIILVNGISVNQQIAVSCICNNVQLTAQAQGVYSVSQPFNVTGIAGNHAYIGGTVTNGSGQPLAGATVWLSGNNTILSVDIGFGNGYQFSDIPPGKYSIYAQIGSRQSQTHNVYLTNETPQNRDIAIGSSCNSNGRTPVLLVPGILGSSYADRGLYPLLPKDPPPWEYYEWNNGSWGLHDPYTGVRTVGWRNLMNQFESQGYVRGCTLIPVPYDWRMDIDKSSREYLEKAIAYAKLVAGTGKVNIIAHSMGGLLTRSYIESDRYVGDIDKLAMVGTPNNGSANAYYLWEGGDPLTLDTMTDNALLPTGSISKFYTKSLDLLHKSMKNSALYNSINADYSPEKNREFIHDAVPSTKQLLPTYSFLNNGNNTSELSKEKNTWLKNLNDNFTVSGVNVQIYAGVNEHTINTIKIGNPDDLYVDGVPNSADLQPSGDGTVLRSSVELPSLKVIQDHSASHASLIDAYMGEIIQFINGTTTQAPAKFAMTKESALVSPSPSDNTLSLTVLGRVSPYIIDSLGNKSGINPVTKASENNIPGGQVAIDLAFGSINIANAADGIYTVMLSGSVSEDYLRIPLKSAT